MNATAHPLHTPALAWIALRPGVSFRPLHFSVDGYALQLRVEPGTTIGRHRHTGEVHAINLEGFRELIETAEVVGPGAYVFEPAGIVDSWRCAGDSPCVVHITLTGRVEYLDEDGRVIAHSDTGTAYEAYASWCDAHDQAPDPALGSPGAAGRPA